MKEMVQVQRDLKCPKNQYNSFGRYNYRSCEGILEAAKPIYTALGCYLNLSDEIIVVGNRVYVRATATLINAAGEKESAYGLAREAEVGRNNMDPAQVTGSASSYARKYALNGLFAIDDTKDADATNTHGMIVPPVQQEPSHFCECVASAESKEDTMLGIESAIMCCNSTQELTDMYKAHPEWQQEQKIVSIFTKRKNELNNGSKVAR